MGAWGTGNFENDDAGDWAWELDEASDLSILDETLSLVTDADGQPESPDCCNALAAAETVAALAGRPSSVKLPESIANYVKRIGLAPSIELVQKAHAAVSQIETDSELRDLWKDSDSYEEWKAVAADLAARLQA